jgi:putative phosphoesterase
MRIGVISDTHGLLRPSAMTFLSGSDRIIHAGDIGRPEVLEALSRLAPITAIRGNNDRGTWAETLPETDFLSAEGVVIYVLHDLQQLGKAELGPEVKAVISGHSHKPVMKEQDGILYLNPGSAGPRRFKLPVTVAELLVSGETLTARIVEIPV